MIKKIQKKKQDSSGAKEVLEEVKRHFNVAIESVKDEVKIIAEQYVDIKKDIHEIKETLDSHTATLDSHTEMIGSMAEDIEIIKIDLADTKKDVEIIKSDIEFIKGGIKKKVDYEEFVVLERRLTLLEAKTRR